MSKVTLNFLYKHDVCEKEQLLNVLMNRLLEGAVRR